MKHIQAFESFKKGYGEKIKQSDFKEIEIGKTVQYGGGKHEIIDNDGYVLTLKGKDGKLTKINLNQFNDKGAINEARSIEKIEKDRSKVVNDMAEIVVNWKAAKESGDKKAEATFLQKLKDLTAKKKSLESELNTKISDKDKDLELIISEDVKVFESLTNPHVKTGKDLAQKIDSWFDWDVEYIDSGSQRKRAERSNQNVIEWFSEHPMIIKKDAYKALEKLAATWGPGYTSKLSRFFGPSLVENITIEESSDLNEGEESMKTFIDQWEKVYGENFISTYPKVAKIVKAHLNVDKRTLSKWWEEIYGQDFEKEFPEMWKKLSEK
jgi:hypothetical protein